MTRPHVNVFIHNALPWSQTILNLWKIFSIRNMSWWKYLKWHTNSTIKSSIPIRGFFMTLLVFKSKYSTIDYLVLASLIQISFQMIWRKNLLIHAISLLKFFRFSIGFFPCNLQNSFSIITSCFVTNINDMFKSIITVVF